MKENASLLLDRARTIVGDGNVLIDDAALDRYGRDETERLCFPPTAAILPVDTDQVSKIMELASRHKIAITPRGGGTGLSGGALPVCGGWVLSLERMNRIRRVDRENLVAEAEAGVTTADLHGAVEEVGLFYPPDPASRETCLLGGNIAEDSAGPRSCKYGSTRRWVLSLEAVLADGRTITTGGDNRKDVAGYNLTQLLIGSEGTLAVVTAATVRLIAKPAATLTLGLVFDRLADAAGSVTRLFRHGHDPSACELIDRPALESVAKIVALPAELRGRGGDAVD